MVGRLDRLHGVEVPDVRRRAGGGGGRSPGGGGRAAAGRISHSPRPGPGRTSIWDDVDLFEAAFDAFDAAGVSVWLQVEPARCSVPMLIDLMYQQYGHHQSVIGFGVDVEWYRKDLVRFGKPVTDAEAQAWVAADARPRAEDLVLVKHWLTEKMPPTQRNGLVFVDDSQGHGSARRDGRRVQHLGGDLRPVARRIPVRLPVGQGWWSGLADPPRQIGNAVLSEIPNTRDLVWVHFTAYDIWPPD